MYVVGHVEVDLHDPLPSIRLVRDLVHAAEILLQLSRLIHVDGLAELAEDLDEVLAAYHDEVIHVDDEGDIDRLVRGVQHEH